MTARALVEDRRRLPDLPPLVRRHRRRRRRRPRGHPTAASTTSRGWASTPSGCRRSSARRWPTSATTSATTATSTRCSARSPTSTALVAEAHDARHQGAARLGAQPHLRPAPVVRRRRGRSRDDPKRDWYVWRDPAPDGGPPNNWVARVRRRARPGPSTRRPASTTCTCFLPEQPDLNWAQPRGRGGDARRAALLARPGRRRLPHRRRPPASARTPTLPDDPPELRRAPHVGAQRPTRRPTSCCAASAPLLDSLPRRPHDGRRGLPARHRRGGHATTATATSCTSRSTSRRCYTPWEAAAWRRQHRARVDGARRRRRLADVGAVEPRQPPPPHPLRQPRPGPGPPRCCCSTLRGTPFLYAGEELGLEDADDPARAGASTPAAATAAGRRSRGTPTPDHGWGTTDPWLPWPPDADAPQRRGASATTRRRSCTSTGGCSPPGARPPRPAARRSSSSLDARPTASLGLRRAARRRRPRRCSSTSPTRPSTDVAPPVERHRRGRQRRRRRGRAVRRTTRARRGAHPASSTLNVPGARRCSSLLGVGCTAAVGTRRRLGRRDHPRAGPGAVRRRPDHRRAARHPVGGRRLAGGRARASSRTGSCTTASA